MLNFAEQTGSGAVIMVWSFPPIGAGISNHDALPSRYGRPWLRGERRARVSGSRSLTGYEPAEASQRDGGQGPRSPERPRSLGPRKGATRTRGSRGDRTGMVEPARGKNEAEGSIKASRLVCKVRRRMGVFGCKFREVEKVHRC